MARWLYCRHRVVQCCYRCVWRADPHCQVETRHVKNCRPTRWWQRVSYAVCSTSRHQWTNGTYVHQ